MNGAVEPAFISTSHPFPVQNKVRISDLSCVRAHCDGRGVDKAPQRRDGDAPRGGNVPCLRSGTDGVNRYRSREQEVWNQIKIKGNNGLSIFSQMWGGGGGVLVAASSQDVGAGRPGLQKV